MKQISSGSPEGKGPGKKKKSAAGGVLDRIPREKREKYLARALTAAAVVGMGIYIISTALPEKSPAVPDPGTGTYQDEAGAPSGTGVQGGTTGTSAQSPFERTDIITADDTAPDSFDSQTTRYWVVTPSTGSGGKTRSHKIQVPLGWTAQAVYGGIRLKPEGFDESAEGAEPLLFTWSLPDEFGKIESDGGYDTGTTVREDSYGAVDYYLTDDGYGDEWPVYVIRHDATYLEEDALLGGSWAEWYIFVAKPSENGLYFMAALPDETFGLLSTPRTNSVPALARELFPPSSEPGRPGAWTYSADTAGTAQDTGGAPEDGMESPEGAAGIPEDAADDDGDSADAGAAAGTEE